jgi:hypothetical protein
MRAPKRPIAGRAGGLLLALLCIAASASPAAASRYGSSPARASQTDSNSSTSASVS